MFRVKYVSPMEKVFPMREPSGEGAPGVCTAFRNENVSFQIAYYWGGQSRAWGRVSVSAPEGISVRVRAVALVPCAYPCHQEADEDYLTREPGLYPDRLEEIMPEGFPMVSGQWRSLWVDIEAGGEAEAGSFEVTVSLGTEEHRKSLTVQAELLEAELPKLDIPHTEWFHCDCLANYYGVEVFSEEHWRIVENFVRTAVRRGCNMLLTPVFTPPLDTAQGGERKTVQLVDVYADGDGYRFGYERFERWVRMCEACGVQYFEISHLFSQWGATAAPKIMAEKDGKITRLFGWETCAQSGEYASFIRAFLSSFTEELRRLGIEKRCYFHISDEPSLEQLDSYRAARSLVKDCLADFPVIDALSNYDFYAQGIVEEPICANDHIGAFLENPPEKLWTYYCTAQWKDVSNRFIAQPGQRTRIIGVQMYKYRIAGFLQWGYNFYNSQYSLYPVNPYVTTDADGAFPSGDAFLVYPGADGVPEESIRLLLMEEAMNDLRALKFLERLTDRESALACLEEATYGNITFDRYPREISYLEGVRTRVNARICEALNQLLVHRP